MNRSKKQALILAGGLLALVALALAVFGPNFVGSLEIKKLSDEQKNLRRIIEAEDEHYQKTGAYFPLEIDSDNSNVKSILGQFNGGRDCKYAVAVSGLAFTAEVKVPVKTKEFNYLGYVRTAPGEHIGVAGKMGVCAAEGIYAGSRKLVNTVGPCSSNSWKTMWVASGSKKRLAIETLPSGASVFIDGVLIGKTTSFHSTINEEYGYLFVADPPKSPINVVVSKEGYSPVSFALDWDDFTYQATVPLRPNPAGSFTNPMSATPSNQVGGRIDLSPLSSPDVQVPKRRD